MKTIILAIKNHKFILFFIILLFINSILNSYSLPSPSYEMSEYEELINISYIHNYEVSGNQYHQIGEDPQIGFNNINKTIGSLAIFFEEEFTDETTVQVYFADEGESLSEAKSVIKTIEKDQNKIYLNLPIGFYNLIRIDINNSFRLDKIIISPKNYIINYQKNFINEFKTILAVIILFITTVALLFKNEISRFISLLRWKKALFICLTLFLCSYGYLIATYQKIQIRLCIIYLCLTIITIIIILTRYKDKKPEFLFLVISFFLGTYLSVILPFGTLVSWDDETHYKRSIEVSHWLDGYVTGTELEFTSNNNILYNVLPNQSQEISDTKYLLDEQYLYDVVQPVDSSLSLYNGLPYIPSAFFLFLGRGFQLPFHTMFYLGRWANVLLYSIIVYYAIKKLKTGKMIMAVIALFPTNIFMCRLPAKTATCAIFGGHSVT